MSDFPVWVRPLGDFCRVRVEGVKNAEWLLRRLSDSFVFKTFEPFREVEGTSYCTFLVPYTPPLSRTAFHKLLAGIPEVRLMMEPA
jgi:hypothetical protein